jgi:RNA-directed DNA polymerase
MDTKEGTMQGGPLSPLLSNIVLDEFDRNLKAVGTDLSAMRTTVTYT